MPPSKLNVAIFVAFVANLVVGAVSQLGLFGRTNAAISREFQSLATPDGWAFAIWGVIFPLQLAYSVAQLAVPSLREAEEVHVAGPWFVATCLLQASWQLAFCLGKVNTQLALIAMVLVTLVKMTASLRRVAVGRPPSWGRAILFHVPFGVHCGWITAATAVSAGVTVVAAAPSAHALLLAVAAGSLTAVFVPALDKALRADVSFVDTSYSISVAWALAGVASQLAHPLDGAPKADPIKGWCPSFVTSGLCYVAAALSAVVIIATCARALFACLRRPQSLFVEPMASSTMQDALMVKP